MAIDILLILLGIALAWLTLRDVFDTVVVPGGARGSLQVTRRVGTLLLYVWKAVRGRRRGITFSFAPLVLVSSFVIWMSLLSLAFGLMIYGVRMDFKPPMTSFGDSVYQAGGALLTIGLSSHFPQGVARWIVVAAGFCGLAVMTMAVTYLLEVQSSISRRDIGIIKLNTSAGNPPSAITLLERFAALRQRNALHEVLEEGRNWCATMRQSHSAHPSLIYFQSMATGAGWPAALGAILDVGLFAQHLIDDDRLYGPAVLLGEEGNRMARELAALVGVDRTDANTDPAELQDVVDRLASSGYPVRADPDLKTMVRQRAEYMTCVAALADHLGKPATPLASTN
jgi:Ion channel